MDTSNQVTASKMVKTLKKCKFLQMLKLPQKDIHRNKAMFAIVGTPYIFLIYAGLQAEDRKESYVYLHFYETIKSSVSPEEHSGIWISYFNNSSSIIEFLLRDEFSHIKEMRDFALLNMFFLENFRVSANLNSRPHVHSIDILYTELILP